MPKETYNEWLSENRYGICRLSILSIYREPVVGSGMTSQLLFGESYEVSKADQTGDWYFIEGQHQAGTGWILKDQHFEISKSAFETFNQSPFQITTSLFSKIKWGQDSLVILPGSQLHADENEIFEWRDTLSFEGETRPFASSASRKEVVEIANIFLHAPYLSGGRSCFGLFGGSWLHLVFKIAGYHVPNYLSPILEAGTELRMDQIQAADVIVFGNEWGLPHHLGLYCGEGLMMEVKGKVIKRAFDPEKWMRNKNNSKDYKVLHVKNLMKR